MRTDPEILARIEEVKAWDWLGTEFEDLVTRLSFDAAKPFLKEDTTSAGWPVSPRDRDSLVAEIKGYMPFAWEKANGCRGISAGRSLSHMRAWLWLACETEVLRRLGWMMEYSHYGKPHLRAICDHYGWDWRQWDDGAWRNNESDDGVAAESVALPV